MIAAFLAAGAPYFATAQAPPPSEPFIVDSATGGTQTSPAVVARGDGTFLVVWSGNTGVVGRRISAGGRPIGNELEVRPTVGTWFATAAARGDGELVVAWNEQGVYPNARLLARRVGADGRARGEGPIVVTESDYGGHDVAMSSSGEFSVVWSDWYGDVLVRTFDAAGVPIGDGETSMGGFEPSITVGDDGNPIVVWRTWGQQGAQIHGQRFTGAGEPLGELFDVSTDLTRTTWNPDVSMSPDGAFVVVWNQSPEGHLTTTESREVVGQRFNSHGVPVGPRFLVHEEDLGGQFAPAVSMSRSGAFFTVWASLDESGRNADLYGQQFDPAGVRVGPTLAIANGVGSGPSPVVAMSDTGSRLVAWDRRNDIFARFLPGAFVGDSDGDGVPDATDNCPTIPNEDQADAQADGYGDACVSPDVVLPADLRLGLHPVIGAGTTLGERVVVGNRARLGEYVALGARVRAGNDVRVEDLTVVGAGTVVGDRVSIGASARIEGAATIEDDVTIGERVALKRRVKIGTGAVIEPFVVVFANATVGAGATVEAGARIGRWAAVSPGTVVPAGTTVSPGTVFP